MNKSSNLDLIAERLESLKAAIIGALNLFLTFAITSLINNLVLARYFTTLSSLQVEPLSLHFFMSAGIAAFCGFLFGVTYRYIIREDKNPQLKAGGVFAFGGLRGLTQLDVGFAYTRNVLPFFVLGLESVLWFAMAAISRRLKRMFEKSTSILETSLQTSLLQGERL